jgi:hypothetical protein
MMFGIDFDRRRTFFLLLFLLRRFEVGTAASGTQKRPGPVARPWPLAVEMI